MSNKYGDRWGLWARVMAQEMAVDAALFRERAKELRRLADSLRAVQRERDLPIQGRVV